MGVAILPALPIQRLPSARDGKLPPVEPPSASQAEESPDIERAASIAERAGGEG